MALPKWLDAFADSVLGTIKGERTRTDAKIAALEIRLAALEARPEIKYCGAYAGGETYQAGSLASRRGGLWLALRETQAAPGTDPEGWRLIVKSGGA
jgi:hypothetical protein